MRYKILTLISLMFALTFKASACNNSLINSVSTVDNMDGTYTFTINLTVDVGGSDGYSYGFALLFDGSAGTPAVQAGFTASLTRATYSTLNGYTGATIGTGPSTTYFSDRYGGRTDILTYESDGATFDEHGSTDYTHTVVVTVDGCVDNITLDADFRSLGSSSANPTCVKTEAVNLCSLCRISDLAAGAQTACDPETNYYTQEVVVTYNDEPGSGDLVVNGQTFAITTSPQTVTLTNLTSDGNAVDVSAYFSDESGCSRNENSLFTAPADCYCGAEGGFIKQ